MHFEQGENVPWSLGPVQSMGGERGGGRVG